VSAVHFDQLIDNAAVSRVIMSKALYSLWT